jgi:ATP-dependent Lon protease
MNDKNKRLPQVIPLLPVRDSVVFPGLVLPLMVKKDEYSKLVDDVLKKDKLIVLSMVKHPELENEEAPEVHDVGTVGQIIKLSKVEDGTVLVIQGLHRVKIKNVTARKPYLKAKVERIRDIEHSGKEIDALMANIWSLFKQIVDLSPHLPEELIQLSRTVEQPGPLADMAVSTLNLDRQKKQEVLELSDVKRRLHKLTLFLNHELELLAIGRKIQEQVKKGIDQNQREFFLKEQLRVIQEELGINENEPTEADELSKTASGKPLPQAVRKVVEKEIQRLSNMNPVSSEYTVARTYVDWLLEMPWQVSTTDSLDIQKAGEILNKYHYDLEKIKKRILEYLAVRKLNPSHKGPILCLAGPPGTGKTSLGRSIAEALGREFVRVSLGGMRDEAEIRGHRRTYVGALPGRIIQGIKKAGSNNPVFILDEIDKLGNDFRGDPSSALLEVLDPEQNFSFSDHYLELEFDLSNVIFIATANQLDPIPPALLDRMEVLELAGYAEEEKIRIAQKFLIPRQIYEHGLKKSRIVFRKRAVQKIIREYTREAGVRNLEREIGGICRGVARKIAENHGSKFIITDEEIKEYCGSPRFTMDAAERSSIPGVATGMAWTPAGGDILYVEATMMEGQKSLVLTGQLGDVMKESAHAALSYLRANAKSLGISEDFYKNRDLHIHVPAGAIPKDGPSAGVTLLTALASLVTARPVRPKLSMTGEVTLRGSVLPVGGIKEKVLAARRSGIKHIILPQGNKHDLDEIPEKIRKSLTFHLVSKMDDVLDLALLSQGKKSGATNKRFSKDR